MKNNTQNTPRRDFIGKLAAGAAAVGLAGMATPVRAVAGPEMLSRNADDPEAWLARIKGKHRIAFDVTNPNETMPFAWPKVFLLTNGAAAKDCSVVVILRHNAIPYALGNGLWAKYKFGEVFKINDPLTKAPAVRNPFWEPKTGDYSVPGIGNVDIGINQLQQDGVMFCACDMALTVFSAVTAAKMNGSAADIKKEWVAGLLPDIQLVPSGVWAVGRVQEHGCAYCFAG
ncbi:MAG: twin-arginine translocation signal domain-containing protein [Bacteroidota bacterium]|nr:twin-arginine translocation signal domain-containing protein [Bacteroidota bacterium]MDP4212003.1 twin-arginine translocation signal domain-containing protein [Bacteroidota bacterium]MDP4249939.1 twin-arginine translocation signal domain-containing protein [Bacteroidota bacterium]